MLGKSLFDEQIFDRVFGALTNSAKCYNYVDAIQKTENGCKAAIELAGVAKDDLSITIENGDLIIKYVKKIFDKTEEGQEIIGSKCLATYDLEKLTATLENGYLILEFTNKQTEQKKIQVR